MPAGRVAHADGEALFLRVTPREPVLSVVTPVLNGGQFFEACLSSVARLAEAVPGGVEHIIADGGSTDGTLDLAERSMLSEGSPVSAVLRGPDRGQSHAINRGFTVARGTWLAWVNADDRFAPGAADIVRRLVAGDCDGCDVLVGRCEFVDPSGATVFSPRHPDLASRRDLLLPLSRWFAGASIVQPEAFIRRSAIERVGGLDESNHLAMDHDLWLRLLEQDARFETATELVAWQTVHAGQKTADNLDVARQILENCRRSISRQPDASADVHAELAELEERISEVDKVLASRRGRAVTDSDAVVKSVAHALNDLRSVPSSILTLGPRAERGVRLAGRRGDSITRASRSFRVGTEFDAVVVDCMEAARTSQSIANLEPLVKPAGHLVLAATAPAGASSKVLTRVKRALGEGVTLRSRPWSSETLWHAAELVGWASSLHGMSPPPLETMRVVDRVPISMSNRVKPLLPVFGLEPSDLAETLVLRRRDAGAVR